MIRPAHPIAAGLALCLWAGTAMAQQTPAQVPQRAPAQTSAAQPSASQLAMAREVAITSGMTRSFDAIAAPMLDQLQQMDVTRPEIKKDLAEVVEILRPEIDQQKQKMVDTAARVFASRFNEQELRDIATFFKSPSGLKYVQTQPEILDDIVRGIATWSQNLSEYIVIRARAEMGKRGHQLQ
jgi:uncharacterized protein